MPAKWQASAAGHTVGVPLHTPAWQESPVVHALASMHAVPSGFAATAHRPVDGLQTPASWHASAAGQLTFIDDLHAPAMQTS